MRDRFQDSYIRIEGLAVIGPGAGRIVHEFHRHARRLESLAVEIIRRAVAGHVTRTAESKHDVEDPTPGIATNLERARSGDLLRKDPKVSGRLFAAGDQDIDEVQMAERPVEDRDGIIEVRQPFELLTNEIAMRGTPFLVRSAEGGDRLKATGARQGYRHPRAPRGRPDLYAVGEAALRELRVIQPDMDVRQGHLGHEARPRKIHRLRDDDGLQDVFCHVASTLVSEKNQLDVAAIKRRRLGDDGAGIARIETHKNRADIIGYFGRRPYRKPEMPERPGMRIVVEKAADRYLLSNARINEAAVKPHAEDRRRAVTARRTRVVERRYGSRPKRACGARMPDFTLYLSGRRGGGGFRRRANDGKSTGQLV